MARTACRHPTLVSGVGGHGIVVARLMSMDGFGAGLVWLGLAVLTLAGYAMWRRRCRHPNPHYVPAATRHDPLTGRVVTEPEHYLCFECGRTWFAAVDPAWQPTGIVQRYTGFEQSRLSQSATRAAIEREQRQLLAARRAEAASPRAPEIPRAAPARRPRRLRARRASAVLAFPGSGARAVSEGQRRPAGAGQFVRKTDSASHVGSG
jgi:hypothetical protein